MDRKAILEFTKHMKELLCSKISVDGCLSIIMKMKGVKKSVRSGAEEILRSLESGTSFSMSLRRCMSLEFDSEYVSFVESSEVSGKLDQVFVFLLKKEEARSKQKTRIIMACIYPAFVVVIALAMSILLVVYGADIVPDFGGSFDAAQFKKDALLSCLKAAGFLGACILVFVLFVKQMVLMNDRLSFFFVMKYLLENGVDFFSGLKFSLGILDKNRRMKEMVLWSISQFELGKSVSESMGKFGEECVCAMEIAEATGSLSDAFSRVTLLYEEKNERASKLFESMLEPAIMCVLAVYVSILLMKVVAPILFNYGI